MNFTQTGDQAVLLGLSLGLGLFGGLLFDIYRRMRNAVAPGRWLTALGDIIYWVIITAITFNLLLRISYGEVRGYIFIALALGLFLYTLFLSPYTIRTLSIFDMLAHRSRRGLQRIMRKAPHMKVIKSIGRIWQDARRIYSKLHKNP
jgi:spore cortex biosynthesis protein YabQ